MFAYPSILKARCENHKTPHKHHSKVILFHKVYPPLGPPSPVATSAKVIPLTSKYLIHTRTSDTADARVSSANLMTTVARPVVNTSMAQVTECYLHPQ
ncbi:hypothetical protein JTE90_023223 [Oedothorax gibbosus]|uniref:Uncharacterized protein n=1 Tax=Oedothorax gibbosus TaxID=931172 RepID=A0AAV6VJD1_9ARAC|nr:hypothetical protein JTE90_023223 [Oedothorax gibbosus]